MYIPKVIKLIIYCFDGSVFVILLRFVRTAYFGSACVDLQVLIVGAEVG